MGKKKEEEWVYHKTDEVLINRVLRCHFFWNKVRMTSCQVTDPMPHSLYKHNTHFIHLVPNLEGEEWRKMRRWQEYSLSLIAYHLCRPRDTEPRGGLSGWHMGTGCSFTKVFTLASGCAKSCICDPGITVRHLKGLPTPFDFLAVSTRFNHNIWLCDLWIS